MSSEVIYAPPSGNAAYTGGPCFLFWVTLTTANLSYPFVVLINMLFVKQRQDNKILDTLLKNVVNQASALLMLTSCLRHSAP